MDIEKAVSPGASESRIVVDVDDSASESDVRKQSQNPFDDRISDPNRNLKHPRFPVSPSMMPNLPAPLPRIPAKGYETGGWCGQVVKICLRITGDKGVAVLTLGAHNL